MKHIDLLISNCTIIPMDNKQRVLEQTALAIDGDTIVAMGPADRLSEQFAPARIIDASGKYLFPGFVSTHTHLFQTLLKGLGRDKPLLDWLNSSVLRVLHLYDREMIRYAALTGLIEAIRTGTTTVLDFQYCHAEEGFDIAVIEAFEQLGVRGILAKSYTSSASYPHGASITYAETEESYFAETEMLCKRYAGHPLVSLALAPTIIWSHDREGFLHIRKLADALKIPITMHVVETEDDDAYALRTWGTRTIPFLDECGLLGPDFIAVHSVHMSEDDITLFRDRGVSVAHCPVANMILASGTAPVPRFLQEGIPVSLAVDGAASNDTQDMLETLKFAALQHKLTTRNAAAVSAWQVLEMATMGGARTLGLENRIGSIEIGKKADLFIYNPLNCRSIPVHDPIASLVYSSAQPNIETVIIHGKVVLDHGAIVGADELSVLKKTQELAESLAARAGLSSRKSYHNGAVVHV